MWKATGIPKIENKAGLLSWASEERDKDLIWLITVYVCIYIYAYMVK